MNKKHARTLIVEQENRNPNNKDSIAYRLNYIIRERRYTAKEVSALTENKSKGLKPIHPSSLSLYINGKSVPNHAYTRRLAQVLKVDPCWLSGDLAFDCINKPKQPNDIDELTEIYTRLDTTWQRCILSISRMVLIGMQYESRNDDNNN